MFRAFVIKEFRHILRDARTLLILIGIPVALIILFGFAISTEIRNVNIGVMYPEDDTFITTLIYEIDQSEYFTVKKRLVTDEQVDDAMRKNQVDAVVCFGQDFTRKLNTGDNAEVSIITDASNPNDGSTMSMYLSGIVQGYLMEQLMSNASVSIASQSVGTISSNTRMLFNPQLRSSYNFVPGILGMIMILICALMTSVSIVREKEVGTMEVLLVSPVKPIAIFFAKLIPYFVLSCVILLIVFILIFTVLEVPIVGSLFWVVSVSLLYVILALGMGLLVSSMVDTQFTATLVAGMMFMLPVMMLSGMLFDVNSMPMFFRVISPIVPARWYIIAIKKIMIEGLAVRYAIRDIAILFGMTVFIYFIAIRRFNDRLE